MGANENGDARLGRSTDFEKESKHGNEGESDYEPARDSLSSHSNEDCNRLKKDTRVPKQLAKKESGGNYLRPTKVSLGRQEQNLQYRSSNNGSKKSQKPSKVTSSGRKRDNRISESIDVPSRSSSELSEEIDDKTVEEVKEIDVLDEAPICDRSVGTDDSVADTEENNLDDVGMSAYQKVEEMQLRIEKLEDELREVAALEVSIYSVVPEHGSSAHKVHTPARRLARLYLHACKHWSQDKRASVAKNTVSGLALVAKSCGNEVPRLMYWLSNTVVLREIVSQTFGYSSPSSLLTRWVDSSICTKKSATKLHLRSKNSSESKQGKVLSFTQQVDDWQETSTFIAALERLESWIFSRAVESVWWQALTPHMQSPAEGLYYTNSIGQLLGPLLGDPKQGSFSVNLWRSAFRDAFSRLCPVRCGGHECGCIPALARLVMEQCIQRLDIAMFNAILRESADEMPTDPVSDPIIDSKVLPVPAGDLSFGSGAQLKNSIGNWVRSLADLFGMDTGDSVKDEVNDHVDEHQKGDDVSSKCFHLLNELSDLLMLPKDMLLDRAIRQEVCPSIGLSLITRILCNFTLDDFCPDPVPGIVLEELNFESLTEGRLAGNEQTNVFPRSASPVVYTPPSQADVAEKIAHADVNSPSLQRKASVVLRRGYTSDDDLDDLDDPLSSLINRTLPVSPAVPRDKENPKQTSFPNARCGLLREVWCD